MFFVKIKFTHLINLTLCIKFVNYNLLGYKYTDKKYYENTIN